MRVIERSRKFEGAHLLKDRESRFHTKRGSHRMHMHRWMVLRERCNCFCDSLTCDWGRDMQSREWEASHTQWGEDTRGWDGSEERSSRCTWWSFRIVRKDCSCKCGCVEMEYSCCWGNSTVTAAQVGSIVLLLVYSLLFVICYLSDCKWIALRKRAAQGDIRCTRREAEPNCSIVRVCVRERDPLPLPLPPSLCMWVKVQFTAELSTTRVK